MPSFLTPLIASVLLLVGCADSHGMQLDTEPETAPDAGPVDTPVPRCDEDPAPMLPLGFGSIASDEPSTTTITEMDPSTLWLENDQVFVVEGVDLRDLFVEGMEVTVTQVAPEASMGAYCGFDVITVSGPRGAVHFLTLRASDFCDDAASYAFQDHTFALAAPYCRKTTTAAVSCPGTWASTHLFHGIEISGPSGTLQLSEGQTTRAGFYDWNLVRAVHTDFGPLDEDQAGGCVAPEQTGTTIMLIALERRPEP